MILFESTFPNDFRQTEIKQILGYATTGKFCQVVSIPGGGKATILRLLAHNRNLLKFHLKEKEKSLRLEYINLHGLAIYDDLQISKFLLISLRHTKPSTNDPLVITRQLHEFVNSLASQNQTLVLLFDHFDEYQNRLPRSFFQLLRDLNSLAKYRFCAVFATRRDLKELIDPEILKEYYEFFIDNTICIKTYDEKAINFLFSQLEGVFAKKLSQKDKADITKTTGGHAKLTKVITELVLREATSPENQQLLANPLVRATLFELWLYLTAQEQQALRELTDNSVPKEDMILENLKNLGLITEKSQNQQSNPLHPQSEASSFVFSIPLFAEFVKTIVPAIAPEQITYNAVTHEITKGQNVISDLLSPQEYRLLWFLIENKDKIAQRSEIISAVWLDAKVAEGISDEAIDQMIFRLRKKIENQPNLPKHVITIKGQGWRFVP